MKLTQITLAVALAAFGSSASAATCADRSHVVGQLNKLYGETLYANAVSKSNHVLEVYTSPQGRTWSILVHLTDRNLSCLAATGEGMEALKVALSKT